MERHTTRVAPQEIFLGDYFSGVFEVLIWALEPGSQRASCRNRKSALFLARNLDFRILKSILGLSAPPAGRRSCEKYIKKSPRQRRFFRTSNSSTLISFMLKHERPKSLWTKQVCDGNQYGGNKLGVGAIILVCRMLIKVMRIIRMVPMMVTRVLEM